MGPRTLWGLLAAVALLWPDRISSAFDGVPLDRPPEAILIGLVQQTLIQTYVGSSIRIFSAAAAPAS